jgi:hypothetical protein
MGDPEELRQEDLEIPGADGCIIHPLRGTPVALIRFDDGRAVTVQVQHHGPATASDDALIYHVAMSLRLGQMPPREPPTGRKNPHEI